MRQRNNLLAGVSMTATERAVGRFMRAPDHDAGTSAGASTDSSAASTTGTTGTTQNNGGGNSGTQAGSDQNQNNTGQSLDPVGFWSEPKPEPATQGTGTGGGGSGTQGSGGDQTQGKTPGQEFTERLQGLRFDDVFNDAVADAIAKGDLTDVNKNIGAVARESVRQSVIMSAQLMDRVSQSIIKRVETMIEGRFGQAEDQSSLEAAFPSARDPAMRPLIESVFSQAKKHHPNDRAKAIEVTRDMLKIVGQRGSKDLGFDSPPTDPGDDLGSGPSSLVEELLARQ